MTQDFFRYPQTPHLAQLSTTALRGDKLLTVPQSKDLLAHNVAVEEKLDGANIGVSVGEDGSLRLQNRGQYLDPPFGGQFTRASGWLSQHEKQLISTLGNRLVLFGEWCAARHTVSYDQLPDWFIAFDVYDRVANQFWSSKRRNELVCSLGLFSTPIIYTGRVTLEELHKIVLNQRSFFSSEPIEGVIVRLETPDFLVCRAKLVRPDFVQENAEHWRRRSVEWNSIA